MKINCIIVEDEPLAQERAKDYVNKVPFLELLGVFDNALEALGFLKNNTVDLLFLDINLGNFSGIQLLENATITSQVVFTTAYQEYALKGYELQVADYLLKPYTFERFVQAVSRVQELVGNKQESLTSQKKFIFVKTEYRLEKINLEDIIYIEGMDDYRQIHTTTKKIMTLQTFTDLEKEIPSNIVCRVHKSYMVAIGHIESIEKDRIKIGNKLIPISDSYRKDFFDLIK
ncbi:chemotaxis protein CheY [bacterium 336/3]|nr:chemotaxis protein CheY [bacterium 336/3]